MKSMRWLLVMGLAATLGAPRAFSQQERHGTVVTEHIDSALLKENRIGVEPRRSVSVYLPPGYNEGKKSYPVIYYFHSFFANNERMFADGSVQKLFDRAITEGVTKEFILVAADYSTPTAGGFYENSSTSGRWLDFTVEELVPFIDGHFRTIPNRDSRGLAGDIIGGYGALKFAMLYPEKFSVVYALHPVGTGTGLVPMASRPDWRKMQRAKTFHDLDGEGFSQIFLSMAQAFLPNPNRPPFYCDYMMEMQNGELKINVENTKKLQSRFLLDQLVEEKGENLKKLRGIKFDWGRYDGNQDHVYANQAFTRKLDELGIEHYAEEYRGNSGDKNWTPDGRVYSEMLPFFNRLLVFQQDH